MTGQDLLQLASKHLGEKYVFGSLVDYTDPHYKGPWDCAEFISWLVYQVTKIRIGVRNNDAYTGYWVNDIKKYCDEISLSEAALIPGAILLRSPRYQGIKIGHIALSDGKGGTIEAHSANRGVCRASIKGRIWQYALLLKNIQYTHSDDEISLAADSPSFEILGNSIFIDEIKQKLQEKKFLSTNSPTPKQLTHAIINYQNFSGLVVDGSIGIETLSSLKIKKFESVKKRMAWFKGNFSQEINQAAENTPFNLNLLTAIAIQETSYIWGSMLSNSPDQVLPYCVGDTLDTPNRSAFPINRAQLEEYPNGRSMFEIAHQALIDVSNYATSFKKVSQNPNKFCRGYGIFQYDLQHFQTDSDFFLQKKWHQFSCCLGKVIEELKNAQKRIPSLKSKTSLNDVELVHVAIAYNRGTSVLSKGFKQGYYDKESKKYYGEYINEYYKLAQTI
ncbi:hypothetical protein [uncultured Acinetobacter sp.]|uniref:hypothetical protein n=1 Tax=uncultured Acinetobacter sp. TaxID=165433 RepID=UPI002602FF72|nr:hypothetical protein [uncultured Acinetobacter sp.]